MAFVQTFDNNYGVRVLQFYSLWPRPDIQFARVFAHPWLHRESNWSLWTFPAHVSICKKCCGRSSFPSFKQCYTSWHKPRQCVGQQLTLHWHQCRSTTKCLCQMSGNLQINWLARASQHYWKLEGKLNCATMEDFKAIDTWALGMIFFSIINPDIEFTNKKWFWKAFSYKKLR